MATSAIRAIEEAITAVLVADTGAGGVMTLVTDVVGDIPDEEELPEGTELWPVILIGHASEKPDNTFGGPTVGIGRNVIIRVHIYSRYQGDIEALRILERVVQLLDFATLTVAGYSQVMCEYLMGRVLVEAKDKIETRHIPAEFRVTVHQ